MNRFLCLLLAPLVAAACADEIAPDDPNVIDHLGAGTMVINVSGLDTVAVGAMVKLIVDRTSSPAANNFVIKERPLEGALFVIDQVFVPEAVYRVTIEIRDTNGQVFLKGTTSSVSVLQGQTTSVTVVLEPSGAVQIVADLAPRPSRFVMQISSGDGNSSNPPVKWLSGTQRVVSGGAGGGEIEYVALAWITRPGYAGWSWRKSSTPLGLLISNTEFQILSGLDTLGLCTITSSGVDFFVVCASGSTVEFYRGDDAGEFTRWGEVSFDSHNLKNGSLIIPADNLGSCQLVLDSQLNLFCAVSRNVKPFQLLRSTAILRAFSATGTVWSPLPPYVGDDGEVVRGASFAEPADSPAPLADAVLPHDGIHFNEPPPVFHVVQQFGMSHMWSSRMKGLYPVYTSSTDRRSWVKTAMTIEANPGQWWAEVRGMVVFKTDAEATWQMIIVDKAGERWLATSPVE